MPYRVNVYVGVWLRK